MSMPDETRDSPNRGHGPRVFLTGASGFIGTNLVDALEGNARITNFDVAAPLRSRHRTYWVGGDIMDAPGLRMQMAQARPRVVIHLAARTDCDEGTTVEEGYGVNTRGTANVLDAIAATPSVERVIITSTQYVSGPEHRATHDQDYGPHTVYGASKVETERLTRAADLPVPWTLIRPVNIWGPWHERYRREFWRVAERGLYVHPAGPPVLRTYGYVGNVVWQIGRILNAPPESVHRRVFYVGDPPIDVFAWADGFCRALRGRGAHRVPRFLLHGLGLVGDGLAHLGRTFPLTTSRYRNMIQSYEVDMGATVDALGAAPFSLAEG
ncbi:MAG: NAD(P)-dependent oxidoreductase, partial [Gemmatimonadota bacterium]|nr:NAD(P)-dependent oxidoreductase [Gemmatimonadota bacterium]